jgi:hypothetical protein
MYCSNLSCKFSRQTQKKLVGFSHYGHFRVLRYAHCSVFFCLKVPISDLELYENLLWETIAIIDIYGVSTEVNGTLKKLSRNLSHFSITDFCGKSNGF